MNYVSRCQGELRFTLKRNSFPSHIIDRTFKQYLDGSFSQKSRNTNDDNNTRYFKLLFVGHYSKIAKAGAKVKLRQLTKLTNYQISFHYIQN